MDEVYGILPPLTVIQGPQDHKHWVYGDGIHQTPARIQEPGHYSRENSVSGGYAK